MVSNAKFDSSGGIYVERTHSFAVTPEALDLGDIVTPGRFKIINNDPTHDLLLLDSVAGNVFMRLKPGEPCQGRFGCAAPAAQGDGFVVTARYRIFPA